MFTCLAAIGSWIVVAEIHAMTSRVFDIKHRWRTVVCFQNISSKTHSTLKLFSLFPSSFFCLTFTFISVANMQLSQTKRKPHKRSRKGCTRCKGRHVRCDEVVPIWCVFFVPSYTSMNSPDDTLLTLNSGNCFKYGHDCSFSDTRPFEIDIMSPNDFATPEPEEQEARVARTESYQTQQSQYQQPPYASQQPQFSQYSQQPQQTQYAQYSQPQSYESFYSPALPFDDPFRSDLSPEAVSALNCYLQVCAESPLPQYCNQMAQTTEEDPKSVAFFQYLQARYKL